MDAMDMKIGASRELTDEAQEDRDRFDLHFADYGCTCFKNPPCAYCTHPGNPANQEDDGFYKAVSLAKPSQPASKRLPGAVAILVSAGHTPEEAARLIDETDSITNRFDDRNLLLREGDPFASQSQRSEDAKLYQWLRQRFVGYDFAWGEPSMIVACFEVGEGFNGGRDISAAISNAMQRENGK